MKITIDTELERIIVPDSFFDHIDKMNEVLKKHAKTADGQEPKLIDYVEYLNEAISKAQENAPIRKSDTKRRK